MPLLKLNNSKINYQYSIGADNFIISEVVNSTCSYESPIVIRDKQTLDIYFGQSYSGRGYHNELLSSGVSLLLQRPVSDKKTGFFIESGNEKFEELNYKYIDLKSCKKKNYPYFSEFPKIGEDDTIYIDNSSKELYIYLNNLNNKLEGKYINIKTFMCFSEFPEIGEDDTIYLDDYTKELFIFSSELNYINIKDLPQNLYSEDKYESWYNRDTLRLCSNRKYSLSEKYSLNPEAEFFLPDPEDVYKKLEDFDLQYEGSSKENSLEFYNHLESKIKLYTSNNFSEHIVLITDGNNIPISNRISDLYPEEKKYYHIVVYLDPKEGEETGKVIKNLLWMEKHSLVDLINSKLEKAEKIKNCGDIKQIHILEEIKGNFDKNPIVACNPRYKTEYPENLYKRGISLVQHFNENPGYFDDLLNLDRTLAFSIKIPKELLQKSPEEVFLYTKLVNGIEKTFSRYLEFPIPGRSNRPFLISLGLTELGLDFINRDDLEVIEIEGVEISWNYVIEEIKRILLNRNYEIFEDHNNELIVYSTLGTVPPIGFSNLSGLEITPNFIVTQDILSLETEPLKRLEFYSKTTGPNDDNIRVKIEKVNYYDSRYRITISRFSYSEIYDLNLFDVPDRDGDVESLDEIINRRSKLVRCKLFREKPDGTLWKEEKDELGWELPTGEWELKRSIKENIVGPEMYWATIKQFSEFNVKEDFLCIPEIERFLRNNIEDYREKGYFTEYLEILEYCKEKNCQALIGNLDFYFSENLPSLNEEPRERTIYRKKSPDNPDMWLYQKVYWDGKFIDIELTEKSPISLWKNTFIYNYPWDYDNFLVYFFRDMNIFGKYNRPSYYLFLRGILGGQYSIGTKEIKYITPFENAYVEEKDEKIFELRKSNYLSSNNQVYFYKNYQNHPGNGVYKTAILTKFALSKISRAIENNKWDFLGRATVGETKEAINRVLLQLKATYNIYQNILLTDIGFNPKEHSMMIRVSVYIRELVDKPISLDIELNYIY